MLPARTRYGPTRANPNETSCADDGCVTLCLLSAVALPLVPFLSLLQAGVHSLFIASGIHADELQIAEGGSAPVAADGAVLDELKEETLAGVLEAYDVRPTHTTRAFEW